MSVAPAPPLSTRLHRLCQAYRQNEVFSHKAPAAGTTVYVMYFGDAAFPMLMNSGKVVDPRPGHDNITLRWHGSKMTEVVIRSKAGLGMNTTDPSACVLCMVSLAGVTYYDARPKSQRTAHTPPGGISVSTTAAA